MISTRKARSTAGTEERATETGTDCETASTSANYSTTAAAGCLQISDFLRHGRGNALHLRELKRLLHKDERTIRLMIQHERRRVPIVSDNRSGYWIGTLNEAEAFARSMRARAFEIQRAAAAVQLAALEAVEKAEGAVD